MKGRKPVSAEARRARGDVRRGRDTPLLIAGREAPAIPSDFYAKPGDSAGARAARARMRKIWRQEAGFLAGAGVLDKADGAILRHHVVTLFLHEAALETLLLSPSGLLTTNSQGVVPHPLLPQVQGLGKEIRATSEQLPLSPWGRQRLNLHGTAAAGRSIDDDLGPARPTLVVSNE